MSLPETIYAHARALPADLQREALDFIEYLEQRYRVTSPVANEQDTEAFLARFAGSLGDDFPDDIDGDDLGSDAAREPIE